MALIIESGSIVTGANSYVTTTELTDFATARGITVTGDPEELLLKAMDYLETLSFIGLKKTRDQPLQWPRVEVWIDAYDFPDDEIPQELKNGQILVALAVDEGLDPMSPVEPAIKQEVFDVFSTTYEDNAASRSISVDINRALYKITYGSGSAGQFTVRRV